MVLALWSLYTKTLAICKSFDESFEACCRDRMQGAPACRKSEVVALVKATEVSIAKL